MDEVSLETVVARVGDLPVAPVDGELVILNAAQASYVGLDDIGRRIWETLEKPIRVDELLRRIAQDYAGDRETMTLDLLDFLNELYAQNLITATEPNGSASRTDMS
ncbi:MAG TPA: PqqD family peptide modification chaperone [Xanthobacteraceae bacterium]|nr:PqqD family peptide modification chaperone [Xanthobacteraceae bacterium]